MTEANSFRQARAFARRGLSVRSYLQWTENQVGSEEQYWDKVFELAGLAGVARRSFWQEHLEELRLGDRKAWEIFWREERKLLSPIKRVFSSQLKFVRRGHLLVVEPGCGPGQLTTQLMPPVLALGGEYLASDRSAWAVSQTRSRLEGQGLRYETGRVIQASASDFQRVLLKYHPIGPMTVIVVLVRFVHHLTNDPAWKSFMSQVGRVAERVLLAETVRDRLPAGRPENRGTKFRYIDEVGRALSMEARKVLWCKNHGDNIAVVDFAKF